MFFCYTTTKNVRWCLHVNVASLLYENVRVSWKSLRSSTVFSKQCFICAYLWSSGITKCVFFGLAPEIGSCTRGASVVWHHFFLIMNRFNKPEAAFPIWMLPKTFSFIQNKLYILNMSTRCVNMYLGKTSPICTMWLLCSITWKSNDISLCRTIHLWKCVCSVSCLILM